MKVSNFAVDDDADDDDDDDEAPPPPTGTFLLIGTHSGGATSF